MTKSQRTITSVLLAAAAACCGAALVFEVPPVTSLDRAVYLAEREFELGGWQRSLGDEAGRRAALAHYARALARFRVLGRVDCMAVTLSRRARVHWERGELSLAADSLRQALALGFADTDEQLLALIRLGDIESTLGDPHSARTHLVDALALARRTVNRPKEAAALNNLALVDHALGNPSRARNHLLEALSLWRTVEAQGGYTEEAQVLTILAEFALDLGRPHETLRVTDRVLAIEGVPTQQLILALRHRGVAELELRRPKSARASLRRALRVARQFGDPSTEAKVRNALGFWYLTSGDRGRAAAELRAALELAERSGDRASKGNALANLAYLHHLLGQHKKALELFGQAKDIYGGLGDRSAVASVLYGRALAERALGRVEAAFASIERAVRLIERIRGEAGGPSYRISLLASRIDLYDAWIDTLMQRHRSEPLGGYARRAFEVSERTRARALLEALSDGAADVSGAPLRPLTLREVQEQVLDEESVLLSYFLGEQRSYLWVVTRDTFHGHLLPRRAEVEKLIGDAYRRLVKSRAKPERQRAEALLVELSALLLAPAAREIQGKRLLIVPDGALHWLPFALLPEPRPGAVAGAPSLLEHHEVVSLPSASLPAALRRLTAGRAPAPGLVAVFAAPTLAEEEDLALLRFAREEAARIVALAPAGAAFSALGPDASRESLLRGDLSRSRIVHFATHALVDVDEPERSALLLAQVDSKGRRRQGRVRAADFQALDLPAELVVLSACRTADTAVRGEGLVGLAWGVMSAGATRVLLSLWPVDDKATADLMAHLYEALLRDGLPPPAALRRAQRRTAERWSSPFYWAGFTLYGEWRGFPVDWRPGLNLPRRTGSESVRANGARGAADARSRQKGEPNGQRAQEDPGPGGR